MLVLPFQGPEQSWQDITQTLGENILVLNDWQNISEISVIPPFPLQFYKQNVYTFPTANGV